MVELVREKGGRFLRKDKAADMWVDIGDDRAKEKTSQALREGAPEIRRKKEKGEEESPQSKSSDEDRKPRSSEGDSRQRWDDRASDDERSGGVQYVVARARYGEEDRSDETSSFSSLGEAEARIDGRDDDSHGDPEDRGRKRSRMRSDSDIIRPALALTRRKLAHVALDELSPHERTLYLNDFDPPRPDIRTDPRKRRGRRKEGDSTHPQQQTEH